MPTSPDASAETDGAPETPDAASASGAAPDGAVLDMGLGEPGDCYLDADHDGFGAGDAVPCQAGQHIDAASGPAWVSHADDCDDTRADRSPKASELCDEQDNDCDDDIDEGDACAEACEPDAARPLGAACDNGLLGSCARTGSYVCRTGDLACDAPIIAPSDERCGDDNDNDCDGLIDEPDAIDAPTWYLDCDGDGYAAAVTGLRSACTEPAPAESCAWTSLAPDPINHVDWDCDDTSDTYKPTADYGLPPAGSSDFDLNCDGQREPAPEASGQYPCAIEVANYLNHASSSCPLASGQRSCRLWIGRDGEFIRAPEVACPDVPYIVRIGCSATARPDLASWPCR